MDKEIKKQLKGKNDDQWSKDQTHSLDNQQNTRIFWYKFIVPRIFFVRSLPLKHSKRDQVPPVSDVRFSTSLKWAWPFKRSFWICDRESQHDYIYNGHKYYHFLAKLIPQL